MRRDGILAAGGRVVCGHGAVHVVWVGLVVVCDAIQVLVDVLTTAELRQESCVDWWLSRH